MRAEWLDLLRKSEDAHKYDHGAALVLTGGIGRTGAARLAARGALRIGAGVVTLGAPGAALLECAVQSTAIMVRRIEDAGALHDALKDARLNALCLGPGTGVARSTSLLPEALGRSWSDAGGVVLDADALTALSEQPPLLRQIGPRAVLTPHNGEFARLFPDLADRLREGADRRDILGQAALRVRATILLKGADTCVAAPSGEAFILSARGADACPWLATAGAGDVLAGFITGLLARGVEPVDAAQIAVALHFACARAVGPGLIAEDLPEALPGVFARLGL